MLLNAPCLECNVLFHAFGSTIKILRLDAGKLWKTAPKTFCYNFGLYQKEIIFNIMMLVHSNSCDYFRFMSVVWHLYGNITYRLW